VYGADFVVQSTCLAVSPFSPTGCFFERVNFVPVVAVAQLIDVFIFSEFCMIALMLEVAKLRERTTSTYARPIQGALTLQF
jgi:hypothetical protein